MSASPREIREGPTPDTNTRLSVERTDLAADRTLMAWIRTAFSMISFGFTIGKFFQYLNEQAKRPPQLGGGRMLAVVLITLGLFSLLVGVWEYHRTIARVETLVGGPRPVRPRPVLLIAVLVALVALLAYVGMFFRIEL
jgi:putative membrane protein